MERNEPARGFVEVRAARSQLGTQISASNLAVFKGMVARTPERAGPGATGPL